jgi:hypothetical protein
VIGASTLSQLQAGIAFTPAEVAGPIGAFVVLGGLAIWVLTAIVRAVPEQNGGSAPPVHGHAPPARLAGNST